MLGTFSTPRPADLLDVAEEDDLLAEALEVATKEDASLMAVPVTQVSVTPQVRRVSLRRSVASGPQVLNKPVDASQEREQRGRYEQGQARCRPEGHR